MKNLSRNFALALSTAAICLSLTPVAFAGGLDASSFPSTISVTGEGKTIVAADKAVVSVSIENTESSARVARQKNNQIFADLKTALQSMGIESKDIHLDYNSGYPNYEYGDKNVRKLTSYTSTYTVSIQVKDISQVDAITDRVSEFDNLSFQNTNYLLEDNEKATDEARAKAVESAAKKAKKLADLYHVTLGPVSSVNETSYSTTPYMSMGGMGTASGSNNVEIDMSLFVSYTIVK